MNIAKNYRIWSWGAVLVTAAYFGYFMIMPRDKEDDFHYRDWGRLPSIDGGRPKPMDTVARTNLMVITHRQTFYDATEKQTYPATKWLLDVLTTPPPPDEALNGLFSKGADQKPAWTYKVFRIENDQLIEKLGLKMREGLRYSFDEIVPRFDFLIKEAERIHGNKAKKIEPLPSNKYTLFDAKVMQLWQHLNLFWDLSSQRTPLVIPNIDPKHADEWRSFRQFLTDAKEGRERLENGGADAQTFVTYAKILIAYDQGNKGNFNKLLTEHLKELEKSSRDRMKAIDTEVFFNEFAPFYRCLEVYVIIAILGALSWLPTSSSQPLRHAAFASMLFVFLVHISGLIIRMYLQDRWLVFVTNLYSSAVFIGLGAVGICLIVEAFYKNGIGIVVGSVTGFCTLIIAHLLSLDGDTLEMMQAVLDTNFWLATHVTCITLGYTTTFVAGLMGLTYIVLGIFTDMLRKDGAANLTRMTYGVLCTGMFLSFVGTVLGGIWADQSWGRFWGWDPKENGALLIVIWIAMILHARWGGMVKARGIAVLSVLGIIVTSWSWFGTNFLGVGLHSYGFRPGAMMTLLSIDAVFLAFALLGACLSPDKWQSFRSLTPPRPDSLPPSAGIGSRPRLASNPS